jgi:sterol O-acyltransferase
MKMHSYCAHNGMLSDIHQTLRKEEKRLSDLLARQSDSGFAIKEEAEDRRLEKLSLEEKERRLSESSSASAGTGGLSGSSTPFPMGTPSIPLGSTAVGTGYVNQADLLRLRLGAGGQSRTSSSASVTQTAGTVQSTLGVVTGTRSRAGSVATSIPLGTSLEPNHTHAQPVIPGLPAPRRTARDPHPLSYSSDKLVQTLATNIDLMRAELTAQGSDDLTSAGIEEADGKAVVWPENVGWKEYWLFMCYPTLVYQLSYPRTTTLVVSYYQRGTRRLTNHRYQTEAVLHCRKGFCNVRSIFSYLYLDRALHHAFHP